MHAETAKEAHADDSDGSDNPDDSNDPVGPRVCCRLTPSRPCRISLSRPRGGFFVSAFRARARRLL